MIRRVAYLSMHTCPLLQPGVGDAGGMNVYIHELARTMAGRGVAVDVFTRRTEPTLDDEVVFTDGYRVIHLDAGPPARLPIADLPRHVGEFAEGVVKHAFLNGVSYDVVHSHYWLSAWAGVMVKEALGIPLANSFHTLGRIKDLTRHPDDAPSSPLRTLTERDVIRESDCVIASTPHESEDLLEHYEADPTRLCTSPPGIDHSLFHPGDRAAARRRLGLGPGPVVLFVGRIQHLKGLEVAVEAAGILAASRPGLSLVVAGGPSGPNGADLLAAAEARTVELGIGAMTQFLGPQPHDRLPDLYRAADVLLMPSRSESFGLVAAEAQACGLPVVATRVGGLAHVVDDGRSGILVEGWEPAAHAEAAASILDDPALAAKLAAGAVAFSDRFSWRATADRLLELYAGITGRV